MPPGQRVNLPTLLVLRELVAQDDEKHGYAVVAATQLAGGTVYTILRRLETAGWVTSRWEDPEQRLGGAPRRRYYRFVEEHRAEATQLLADRLGPFRKAAAHARPPAQ